MSNRSDLPTFPEEFHWLEGAVFGAYGLGESRKIAIGLRALSDDEKLMLNVGVSSIGEIVKKALFAYERQAVFEESPDLESLLAFVSSRTEQEMIVKGLVAMPIEERALLASHSIQSKIKKAKNAYDRRVVLDEFPSLKVILDTCYGKHDQDKILKGLASIPKDERRYLSSEIFSVQSVINKALNAFEANGRLANIFPSSAISEFVSDKRNALSRYSNILNSSNSNELTRVEALKEAGDELLKPVENHKALKSGFLGIDLHRAIEVNDEKRIIEILNCKEFTIDVLKAMHEAAKAQPDVVAMLLDQVKILDQKNIDLVSRIDQIKNAEEKLRKIKNGFTSRKDQTDKKVLIAYFKEKNHVIKIANDLEYWPFKDWPLKKNYTIETLKEWYKEAMPHVRLVGGRPKKIK